MTAYLGREIAPRLARALQRLPVVVLSGLRQVGKSTLLQHESVIAPGHDDRLRGALFETWVHQNRAALVEAHLPDAKLSYWHEQSRHEVDFVVESGRRVAAIEVKAASRRTDRDLAGLRAFLERTPRCVAAVLAYNGKTAAHLGGRLWAIPISLLVG
jgi:hypothetical protein